MKTVTHAQASEFQSTRQIIRLFISLFTMQKKPAACIIVDFKVGEWGAVLQFQAKNEMVVTWMDTPK